MSGHITKIIPSTVLEIKDFFFSSHMKNPKMTYFLSKTTSKLVCAQVYASFKHSPNVSLVTKTSTNLLICPSQIAHIEVNAWFVFHKQPDPIF